MDEAAAGLGEFLSALRENTRALDANSAALHRLGEEFSKLSANAPSEGVDPRKSPAERLAAAAAEAGAEELARSIKRYFRGGK